MPQRCETCDVYQCSCPDCTSDFVCHACDCHVAAEQPPGDDGDE